MREHACKPGSRVLCTAGPESDLAAVCLAGASYTCRRSQKRWLCNVTTKAALEQHLEVKHGEVARASTAPEQLA